MQKFSSPINYSLGQSSGHQAMKYLIDRHRPGFNTVLRLLC